MLQGAGPKSRHKIYIIASYLLLGHVFRFLPVLIQINSIRGCTKSLQRELNRVSRTTQS